MYFLSKYVSKLIELMSQKIILQLWDERPRHQQFELPVIMFEKIESWVHEFTELSIWNTLHSFGYDKDVLNLSGFKITFPNGEKQIHKPSHVLAALHTISIIKSQRTNKIKVIQPNDYVKLFHKL